MCRARWASYLLVLPRPGTCSAPIFTWADDLLGFVEFAGELNLTRISLETGE